MLFVWKTIANFAATDKQKVTMNDEIRKPTVHSMKRRSNAHDYSRHGTYHITISVAGALGQPLGRIAGRLDRPDGDKDAPHVELSPIGRMVEEELRVSIRRYYPMLEVQEYVIMPEHLHFLLVAKSRVLSQSGKPTHLGHVIAGFKLGCNKRYWAMTGRINLATESPGTREAAAGTGGTVSGAHVAPGTREAAAGTGKDSVLSDSVAKNSLPPLFAAGYCDVMPVDAEQLATQRAYILNNPRSRLLRNSHRAWLYPQRRVVDTAVSIPALRGYLQRECRYLATESPGTRRAMGTQGATGTLGATGTQGATGTRRAMGTQGAMGTQSGPLEALEGRLIVENYRVVCDGYGDTGLLKRRLLPVVCHRRDAALFQQQKERCLAEAAAGAVLVSARISKGEQEILDAALLSGYPVIRIEDNGFPDVYHPSADRTDDCAAGLLLLLTPWTYQFRAHNEGISETFCKTMNCIAQALSRTRDDWWKG